MRAFDFIVADDRTPAPATWRVEVSSPCRAREVAERILGETPHRLHIEVWENGSQVFALAARDLHAA